MLRIVLRNILPGMLLTVCAIGVCSDTVEAQTRVNADSKQMYSNRAIGYTVPTPYYGTPTAPWFMVPPTAAAYVQTTPADVPAKSVSPGPLAPALPVAAKPSTSPTATETPIIVLRESSAPVPEINVDDASDTFYARLAKIQLEKHQLDETLTLVKNIKSEVFRVHTLVDLAEYVSRDKNYQSEAEQLYRLALSGTEALNKQGVTLPPAPQPSAPQPPAAVPAPPAPVPDPTAAPAPAVQPSPGQGRPSPILLQDDSAQRKGTGKQSPPNSPPNPPRGNGVDGGLERIVGSL